MRTRLKPMLLSSDSGNPQLQAISIAITRRRNELKLRQTEVAEKTGLSTVTISRLENLTDTWPEIASLQAVCDVLGLSLCSLICNSETAVNTPLEPSTQYNAEILSRLQQFEEKNRQTTQFLQELSNPNGEYLQQQKRLTQAIQSLTEAPLLKKTRRAESEGNSGMSRVNKLNSAQQEILRSLWMFPGGATTALMKEMIEDAEIQDDLRKEIPKLINSLYVTQTDMEFAATPDDFPGQYKMRFVLASNLQQEMTSVLPPATKAELTTRFVHAYRAHIQRILKEKYSIAIFEEEERNIRHLRDLCTAGKIPIEDALDLAALLRPYWTSQHHLDEGKRFLGQLLDKPEAQPRTLFRLKVINILGELFDRANEYEEARRQFQVGLKIAEELAVNDPQYRVQVSICYNNLGMNAHQCYDYRAALDYYTRALEIERKLQDPEGLAIALNQMGCIYKDLGKQEGHLAKTAIEYYSKALQLSLENELAYQVACARAGMGIAYFQLENDDEAKSLLLQALDYFAEIGDLGTVAEALEALAKIATVQEAAAEAAKYFGWAENLRFSINRPTPIDEREENKSLEEDARKQIGDGTFNEIFREARQSPQEDIIEAIRSIKERSE